VVASYKLATAEAVTHDYQALFPLHRTINEATSTSQAN
jgi:hypothetical protein